MSEAILYFLVCFHGTERKYSNGRALAAEYLLLVLPLSDVIW